MYTNCDLIIYALCIIAVYRGWRKGTIQSLITPGSYFAIGFLSILYYDISNNIIESIFITAIGAPVVAIILKFLFYLGRRSLNNDEKKYVHWASRIMGMGINLGWQLLIIVFALTVVMATPNISPKLKAIKGDIEKAQTYNFLSTHIVDQSALLYSVRETLNTYSNPVELDYVKSLPEFNRIVNNNKYQQLLLDPAVMEQIENKDIVGLMQNGRITDLLADEKFMKEISKLNAKIFKEKSTFYNFKDTDKEEKIIYVDEDETTQESYEDYDVDYEAIYDEATTIEEDPIIIIDQR